jgi:hypothetical protein
VFSYSKYGYQLKVRHLRKSRNFPFALSLSKGAFITYVLLQAQDEQKRPGVALNIFRLEAGVNLRQIQSYLGHNSVQHARNQQPVPAPHDGQSNANCHKALCESVMLKLQTADTGLLYCIVRCPRHPFTPCEAGANTSIRYDRLVCSRRRCAWKAHEVPQNLTRKGESGHAYLISTL